MNKKLENWLVENDARLMLSIDTQGGGCLLKYIVNGSAIWVELYPHDRGWEIYTSLNTPTIDATFQDAEQRVGLKKGE